MCTSSVPSLWASEASWNIVQTDVRHFPDLEWLKERDTERCRKHGWLEDWGVAAVSGCWKEPAPERTAASWQLQGKIRQQWLLLSAPPITLKPSSRTAHALLTTMHLGAPWSSEKSVFVDICRFSWKGINISNLPLLCRKYCSSGLIMLYSRKPHTFLRAQKYFLFPCGFWPKSIHVNRKESALIWYYTLTHSVLLLHLFSTFHFISLIFISVFIHFMLTLAC